LISVVLGTRTASAGAQYNQWLLAQRAVPALLLLLAAPAPPSKTWGTARPQFFYFCCTRHQHWLLAQDAAPTLLLLLPLLLLPLLLLP
jgi:hypothetical protein